MTELKKLFNPNEAIIKKVFASEYFTESHHEHGNIERNLQIRDELYREIIKLIGDKRYYMLGPEKGLTARFIAENYQDIFQILIKNIQNYDINQNIKRRE